MLANAARGAAAAVLGRATPAGGACRLVNSRGARGVHAMTSASLWTRAICPAAGLTGHQMLQQQAALPGTTRRAFSTDLDVASAVVDSTLSWGDRVDEAKVGAKLMKQRYPKRNQLDLKEVNVRKTSMKGSVQKANHLARLVRKLPVPEALTQLRYCRKLRSVEFMQMIKEGVKHAEEKHGLTADQLTVAIVQLGRGTYLKRPDFKGRGRTGKITIPSTHVHIVLREKPTRTHFQALEEKKRAEREGTPSQALPDLTGAEISSSPAH
ncbi:50S ribosomal protein L22, chloroplastic [Hondaea fermentalgiana]|uniref:50S ribosomal protein L22, chloroplastic n=1 Tax=Hondaea fermentalgiana TaxID=2315210 RepID=A0A2R5G0I2_9STRA|nr:50S ribosomal protein L22, chloroplastic [Hondaea fermentalgiana]|eukprot:GBG24537.1 50S ribosomal protein L22, chloroplastic [Hondaea fermentalgiana]